MPLKIASTAIIHDGVVFEGDAIVEDWCIIGNPPMGNDGSKVSTVIGDGAIIRSHTIIYSGNHIGKNFRTGNKANIRENNTIGNDVSIGTNAVVEHHVTLQNGVRLHSQSYVPEYCVLEEGAWLGPNAVLTNTRYPLSQKDKTSPHPVHMGKEAIVGANATILPGVHLGKNSIVGAGSVVTHNVESCSVVAGNPAVFIKNKEDLPYE